MAKRLEWLESFRTGHAEIDRDHGTLVDDVNRIAANFEERRGDEAYRQCLELRADCKKHFETENGILQRARFPRWEEHIASHAGFMERLTAYCTACGERCRKSQEEECLSDLTSMLLEHFVKGDLDFKSYLEQMGNLNGGTEDDSGEQGGTC